MPQQIDIFRLCLDLNVFFSATWSDVHEKRDRSSSLQELVAVARAGACAIGPTQLIISWGMLNRLRKVYIEKLPASPTMADILIRTIAGYVTLGPEGVSPSMLLGGSNVLPIWDEEDRHVLEVALAGRAQVLATGNFKDFRSKMLETLVKNRIAIHHAPDRNLIIANPGEVWQWIRQGQLPTVDELRARYQQH